MTFPQGSLARDWEAGAPPRKRFGHSFERLIYACVPASLPHLLWNCNTATEKVERNSGSLLPGLAPVAIFSDEAGWMDVSVLVTASTHMQWWQILLKVLTFIFLIFFRTNPDQCECWPKVRACDNRHHWSFRDFHVTEGSLHLESRNSPHCHWRCWQYCHLCRWCKAQCPYNDV